MPSFSGPTEDAIQFVADELSNTNARVERLEATVRAQGAALQFLKHICVRNGIESQTIWNDYIERVARRIETMDCDDGLRHACEEVAEELREYLIEDSRQPPDPSLRVIEGGRE